MADNYLSFTITPTAAEKALLLECYALTPELDGLSEDEDEAHYNGMSEDFRQTFPKVEGEGDPFHSFKGLFGDPDFLIFDVYISDKGDHLWVHGDQADPDELAALIQKCAPSTLPFAFEWAQDCSKMRSGGFGGGYYVVTKDDLIGGSTGWLMKLELQKLKEDADLNQGRDLSHDADDTGRR